MWGAVDVALEWLTMRIAYVDEAYDDTRYRLAAVMIEPNQVNPLAHALDDLAGRLHHDFGIVVAELHGYEVFQGHGAWRAAAPRIRIWAFRQVIEALADAGATIAVVGRDRPVPLPRRTFDHVAIMGLLVRQLDRQFSVEDGHVLVVADEHASAAECRQLLRAMQADHPATAGGAHLRVIDSVHFVRSHESRPVQAADFVAFLVRRSLAEADPRKQATNESLLKILEPLIVTSLIEPDVG
jgi:hypothetical protein